MGYGRGIGYGLGTGYYRSGYSGYSAYVAPGTTSFYSGYMAPAYGYGGGYPGSGGIGYGAYGSGRSAATYPFMGLPRANAGLVRLPY